MLSLYPCPVQAWDTLPLMLSVARLTVSTLKVLSWGWAPAKGLRAQKPEHLFLLKKKRSLLLYILHLRADKF